MVRQIRIAMLQFLVLAVSLGTAGAPAALGAVRTPDHRAAVRGPTVSCNGQTVSAVDQYCEQLPGPTGGRGTRPGSPELGSTLPAAIIARLQSSAMLRPLLTLPAAGSVRPPVVAPLVPDGAGTDTAAPARSLLLVLAAIAALMAAAAAIRRHRRRRALGAG